MSKIYYDLPNSQCSGEELERAKRMVRHLKAIKKTGAQISRETGICKGTSQRYIGDPPGLPSRRRLKILEDIYGEQ